MTNEEIGQLLTGLALLLLAANLLGQLATRLHQPKVVGEILAGILFGPSVVGQLAPAFSHRFFGTGAAPDDFLVIGQSFVYQLGLLLLMFVSGAAVRSVLGKETRRETAWLLAIGTPLPFLLTLLFTTQLSLDSLMGPAQSRWALLLIFCCAVAVTSIPVITKIFSDLGILHTRFASLMLGSAVLEDIILWGVAAVATALAAAEVAGGGQGIGGDAAVEVLINLAYVAVAMTVMPRVLRFLSHTPWNLIAINSPVTWALLIFLTYISVAAALNVTLAFAAFLAGFGLIGGIGGTERLRFRAPMQSITEFSQGLFIPLYFAIVGLKLDFTKTFSLPMLLAFLVGSSALAIVCGGLAARLAGFRGRAVFNVAITGNARGGPGILLASVGYEAGIISQAFFTTLVVTAVVTSQMCGVWLDYVLRKGWSLLGETPEEEAAWAAEPVHTDEHDESEALLA